MDLFTLQRNVAISLMASDKFGGRDLLINGNHVRGKLALRHDAQAPVGWETGINQQQWLLSVPQPYWPLSDTPQAQSELTIDGADIPEGFRAGVHQVIEVIGLDPNINLVLQRNF